jgi:hypothetical protein
MREASSSLMMKASWQLMMMGQEQDGTPVMIPIIDPKQREHLQRVLPADMVNFYAERIKAKFDGYEDIENPYDVIALFAKNNTYNNEYTTVETDIKGMEKVMVMKGASHSLAKMILNRKKEGKLWDVVNRVVSWTKFMAIGMPYMSYFHKAALLESAIASRGLNRRNMIFNSAAEIEAFHKFVETLHEDPSIGLSWLNAGFTSINSNPDFDSSVVIEDLEWAIKKAKQAKHHGVARAIERFLNMKKSWDHKLWTDFHAPLKIWVAQGYLEEARERWNPEEGLFPESAIMRQIAEEVDGMFGGNNFSRHLWATPVMKQVMNSSLFAFDWTYSALKIAGAGNLAPFGPIFNTPTHLQNKIKYQQYWPAFIAVVGIGIPNALQAMIYGLNKVINPDDDEMMPFTVLNEAGRTSYIDITPLARGLNHIPLVGRLATGTDDGRRMYIRWGKQGHEVLRWMEHPVQSLGFKLSIPLKEVLQQVTGKSVGGWDLAYKDADFLGALEARGSFLKSRIGNIVLDFTPFTVQDILKGRPVMMFAQAKKGKHAWYATKELTELYLGYTDRVNWRGLSTHKKDVMSIGYSILDAVRLNGGDVESVQKKALQNARAELYEELHEAMSKKRIEEAESIAIRIKMLEDGALTIKKGYKKG